ncbi:small cysteine and glycine repeat-containing protein 7-like [Prionailurus bengalensis]|uniref:small cysteine and glycine repeat-containing protein 7-like n=1 Tax=Prionailurus bengalensis TaxID=37029 RepID=UPI001CA7C80D|nr:small cysteine and glycine repeat-containing protein 7-like [Prionailurus bengalensis]
MYWVKCHRLECKQGTTLDELIVEAAAMRKCSGSRVLGDSVPTRFKMLYKPLPQQEAAPDLPHLLSLPPPLSRDLSTDTMGCCGCGSCGGCGGGCGGCSSGCGGCGGCGGGCGGCGGGCGSCTTCRCYRVGCCSSCCPCCCGCCGGCCSVPVVCCCRRSCGCGSCGCGKGCCQQKCCCQQTCCCKKQCCS